MTDNLNVQNSAFSESGNRIDIQALKSRIDCRDVARRLLGEPYRSKSNHDVYYSPFRDDGSRAAFTVYEDGVKDHGGDGYSADVIGFVQEYFKIDFIEAIRYLTNEDYFQPAAQKKQPRNKPVGEPPPNAWQLAMRNFIEASHHRLLNAPDVLTYLEVERGLSIDTIKRYQLGWNDDWTDTGFRDGEGIVKAAPGILIPWQYDGLLWAVRVRLPVGSFADFMGSDFNRYQYLSESKYLSIRGSRQSAGLFGSEIVAGDEYIILEGEFDAMLANERGPWKAVTRGSAGDHANISPQWIDRLQQAEIVYSLLDNDEAGQLATKSLQKKLTNLQPLRLPVGKDYTEFIIKHSGQPSALTAQAALWWAGTMPDSWRSAILNYMPSSAAPVIELLHEATRQGCINPCCFTIDDLLDVGPTLGFDLPRSTVKRIVKETRDVFISKVDTLKSQTVDRNSSLAMSTIEINVSTGRRPDYYRLKKLPEIRQAMLKWARPRIIERHFPVDTENELLTVFEAAMLESVGFHQDEAETARTAINRATAIYRGEKSRLYQRKLNQAERVYIDLEMTLSDSHSYELPPAKVSNAQDYRALYFRAQVEAGVNERSQREIAAAVGVSRQYVGTLQKRAGIAGEEQFKTVEFTSANVHAIEKTAYEVQGFPRSIIIDGRRSIPYRRDEAEAVVNEAVKSGHVVQVSYQVASKQVIVRDDPLPVPEAAPQPPKVEEQSQEHQMSFDDLLAHPDEQPEEILPDDPPDEVEQPQKVSSPKVTRIKPGKYFGPEYDRAWVYHQLGLALQVSGSKYRLRGIALVDTSTGEVVRHNANERDLVAAILDQTIEAETFEYDELLYEGVQLGGVAQ